MFDVLRNFWCYLNTSAIKAIKKNLLVFSTARLIAVKCIFDSAALKLSKSEIQKRNEIKVTELEFLIRNYMLKSCLKKKNHQFLSADWLSAVVSFISVCPSSAPSTGTNKASSSTAPNKVAGECISQRGGSLRVAIK